MLLTFCRALLALQPVCRDPGREVKVLGGFDREQLAMGRSRYRSKPSAGEKSLELFAGFSILPQALDL
jgi:hypothetical protein